MLVYRMIRPVGKPHSERAAQRWADIARAYSSHAWRVYTQGIGPRDVVVVELEYGNVVEMAPILQEHLIGRYSKADPAAIQWLAKAHVSGGADEIWVVYAAGGPPRGAAYGYVMRMTRRVGTESSEEVAEAWAAGAGERAPHAWRVYTHGTGPRDTVVMEIEFASIAEMAPMMENVLKPSSIADEAEIQWWAEVGVPGGMNEIWNLYAAG
ncbi:MAG: hypothetical protein V1772_07920 [Chloroflexota bacterium]